MKEYTISSTVVKAVLGTYGSAKEMLDAHRDLQETMVERRDFNKKDGNFSHRLMNNCVWKHCGFRNIEFTDTVLQESVLSYCWFRNCVFTRTALYGVKMDSCVFTDCTFRHITSSSIDFKYAMFIDCVFEESTIKTSNFNTASFLRTNFKGSAFLKCDFVGAVLQASKAASKFLSCDFYSARFEKLDLSNGWLQNCNLTNCKNAPPTVSFGKHQATFFDRKISIGCRLYSFRHWLNYYKEIGYECGYTYDEIEAYGALIKTMVTLLGWDKEEKRNEV